MKKVISLIIIVLVMIQMGIAMIAESNIEIKNMANLEKKYCQSFSIPRNQNIEYPDTLFRVLVATAKEMNVNIFRTRLIGEANSGFEVEKYVLLMKQSNYYDEIQIESGDNFKIKDTQRREVSSFLSTKETNSLEQLGLIKSHMYKMNMKVRPLYQQFDYFKGSGLYYVELKGTQKREKFIESLQNNIKKEFDVNLKKSDFDSEESNVGIPYADTGFYRIISSCVMLLIIIFTMYYLFRESKQIAVMRLYGMTLPRIVFVLQKNFHITYIFTMVVGFIGVICITKDLFYVFQIARHVIILYFILFFLMVISNVFIVKQNKLNLILNGKTSTNGVLILNYIGKLICIFIILYAGQSVYQYYTEIRTVTKMYQTWKDADDYGVFYPFYIGNEQTGGERLETEAIINRDLYPILNELGAIYINSRMYEEENFRINPHGKNLSVIVNPNYLTKYVVYDERGKEVVISEDMEEWILLVPKKYQSSKVDILKAFKGIRESMRYVDEDNYKVKTKESVNRQKIKIIWIKDGQKIFSFNPDVYPKNDNTIEDAIIQVLTEDNSYLADRDCILGNGGTDPLKVKLKGDSKKTYQSIHTILLKLKIEDNLKHIVSINENAQESLNITRANWYLSLEILGVILLVFLGITLQNLSIIFDKYKKDFIIKRMFGWNWNQVYGKHLLVNNGLFFTILIGYKFLLIDTPNVYLLYVGVVLVVLEIFITYLYTKRLEKSRITNALKGE